MAGTLSYSIRPPGIPHKTFRLYMMRNALPVALMDRFPGHDHEPTQLVAVPPDATAPVEMWVHPGEIVQKFTHATPADREALEPFVRSAQEAWGYLDLRDAGGRPADTEGVSLEVARLKATDPTLTAAKIAAAVGYPDSDADRARTFVRAHAKKGAALWRQRLGPEWERRLREEGVGKPQQGFAQGEDNPGRVLLR